MPTTSIRRPLVTASYYLSANTSTPSTSPVNLDVKEFDNYNAVTTGSGVWVFTAPYTSTYLLNGFFASTASAAYDMVLYKNGSAYKSLSFGNSNISAMSINNSIQLNIGDTIHVRPSTGPITFVGGTLTTAQLTYLCISEVNSV